MPTLAPFKLLVVGGGPAAIEAVLAVRDLAPDGTVHVHLLASDREYVYRPMSLVEPSPGPGLRRYSRRGLKAEGATVTMGRMKRVDAGPREVVLATGRRMSYDALLVAAGAWPRPAMSGPPTFAGPDQAKAMLGIIRD